MKKYTEEVTYNNFYTNQSETMVLNWSIEEGFETLEEAEAKVRELGYSTELFTYILFDHMYYPVTIETLARQIVIAKNYVWYCNSKGSAWPYYSYDPLVKYKFDEINKADLPIIERPRITNEWTNTMISTLTSFDSNFKNIKEFKEKKLNVDAKILFGSAMFDTDIPVYQLNVTDKYFADAPSTWRLWEDGVEYYNPFSQKRIYKIRGKIFSIRKWAKANGIKSINYDCKAAKKDPFKNIVL